MGWRSVLSKSLNSDSQLVIQITSFTPVPARPTSERGGAIVIGPRIGASTPPEDLHMQRHQVHSGPKDPVHVSVKCSFGR